MLEIFGLSTLDTVTCALAGSIVLLIFMASFTKPEAAVQLVQYRELRQAGTGAKISTAQVGLSVDVSAPALKNLIVVYLKLDQTPKLPVLRANGCNSTISVSPLRSAAGHFPGDSPDPLVAFVAWHDSKKPTGAPCNDFTVEIAGGWAASRCAATLVSGAHVQFQRFDPCPRNYRFISNGDDVFRFDRGWK